MRARTAIVAALLAGKAVWAGMFGGLPGHCFRHIDLTGNTGHLDKRHRDSVLKIGLSGCSIILAAQGL